MVSKIESERCKLVLFSSYGLELKVQLTIRFVFVVKITAALLGGVANVGETLQLPLLWGEDFSKGRKEAVCSAIDVSCILLNRVMCIYI